MNKWTHIIIHCSAGKDHPTMDWDEIRHYHTDDLGWQDVGYHFGVEKVGNEYAAMIGRPLTMHGAHCRQEGMNRKAIGVCVVGNFDMIEPTQELYTFLAQYVVIPMMETYNIQIDNVKLHRQFNKKKTCPGMNFDLDVFKTYLQIENKRA